MKEMKLLQLIFRTCRAPFFKGSPRFITCRPMNTSVDLTLDDTEMDASEHIKKQLLQAGLHYLKTDIERLKENVVNRAAEANVDELVLMHEEYKQLVQTIDELRHKRNVVSKQFINLESKEEKAVAVEEGTQLKNSIAKLEEEKVLQENKMVSKLSLLPNFSHPESPVGGYEASTIVEVHGDKKEFSFPVKDHIELGESLNLFDFRAASNASGHSFYYLKGAAAMLEIALVQYAMQKVVAKGYVPVITPDIIKTDLVEGCGFQPRGLANQVYHVTSNHHGNSNLCLTGTAEIPLAGMFMNRVLSLDQFPLRLAAFGRCFRAEAGGHGHATRGLYRVHQFSKVELFGVTSQETGKESEHLLAEMVMIQKEMLSSLGLHYRVLDMATAELGAPAYRKFDIEVWMPGRGEYGEVTSASNCTDYQSRRLLITYPNPHRGGARSREPGRKYGHTVNGTACAVPRIIIALLENYQQEDGSIFFPHVLRPFLPEHFWHIKQL